MKAIKFSLVVLTFLMITSCNKKDKCSDVVCPIGSNCVDGTCITYSENIKVIGNISTNTTFETGKTYELQGRITVLDGITLTIEPGVIIKGQAGSGVNASCLLISRGAKLVAEGTVDLPIIFTSIADNITIEDIRAGRYSSPNLTYNNQGLWGGLIILGKAPISASLSEIQIEGIPTTDMNGLYGGNDSLDNSGILRYVSIRHGGTNIGNGNEINGLTLGGVGSGTIIDNIEVIGNQDDGIEFFGGNVDVTNVVIWNSGDDAIDVDQSWGGSLENVIIICGDATDHAFEIDGGEGSYTDVHYIRNASIMGNELSELGDFRACAKGVYDGFYFFNFGNPLLTSGRCDLSLTNPSGSTCTVDNFSNGSLVFSNFEIKTSFVLSDIFLNGVDVFVRGVLNRTVGADKSVFVWSWSYQNLFMSEF